VLAPSENAVIPLRLTAFKVTLFKVLAFKA
jgi:hypothetical protein